MERDGMEQLLLEQIVVVVVVVVNVIDVVVSKINRTSLSLEDYEGKSNDVVVGRLRIDRTMLLLLDADYGTEWNGTMLLLLRCWKKRIELRSNDVAFSSEGNVIVTSLSEVN